ncbi:11946_t:CDS:2 [Funneliformis mosseae]|uniref:11946_t:CDS:1 n=1 Tax=Funneliformis mosseae TaxID=27381 RepID=A0A9N9D8P7_FUNMO|nr:11946_t:CDS:2 [Funneliformis mosseae]
MEIKDEIDYFVENVNKQIDDFKEFVSSKLKESCEVKEAKSLMKMLNTKISELELKLNKLTKVYVEELFKIKSLNNILYRLKDFISNKKSEIGNKIIDEGGMKSLCSEIFGLIIDRLKITGHIGNEKIMECLFDENGEFKKEIAKSIHTNKDLKRNIIEPLVQNFIKIIEEIEIKYVLSVKDYIEFIKKLWISKSAGFEKVLKRELINNGYDKDHSQNVVQSYFKDRNFAELDEELTKDFFEQLTKLKEFENDQNQWKSKIKELMIHFDKRLIMVTDFLISLNNFHRMHDPKKIIEKIKENIGYPCDVQKADQNIYDEFIYGYVSYVKNSNENFLKYGTALLIFAIEAHDTDLIDSILLVIYQ